MNCAGRSSHAGARIAVRRGLVGVWTDGTCGVLFFFFIFCYSRLHGCLRSMGRRLMILGCCAACTNAIHNIMTTFDAIHSPRSTRSPPLPVAD